MNSCVRFGSNCTCATGKIALRKKGSLNTNFNSERNVGRVSFQIKVGIQRDVLSYARAN